MAPAGLHEFLALTEGRPDGEIAHVLAALTSTTHHIDQHKEKQMSKPNPKDMSSDELTQEWRDTGDRFYAVREEMDSRFSSYLDANPITDDELKGGR